MIKINDVTDLANLKGKVIEFTKGIEADEGYADAHMRARLTGYIYNRHNDVRQDEMVHVLYVDYSEFDEHNQKFEQNTYYDKDGVPCLSARQAGYYHPQDHIYIGTDLHAVLIDPVTELPVS